MQEHGHADHGEEHIYSTLQHKLYKFLEACLMFFLVSAISHLHFHVFCSIACHPWPCYGSGWPSQPLHSTATYFMTPPFSYNPSAFLSKTFLKTDTCNHCLIIGNISALVSSQCHSPSPASAGQQQPTSPPPSSPKAAVPTSSP